MKLLCLLIAACGCLCAQNLVIPVAATFLDGHGRIARVHGVLGNLLPPEYAPAPEPLLGEAILSAAFDNGGVIKSESHLIRVDGENVLISSQAAPAGPALFSFTQDGTPMFVFYPLDSELVNLTSGVSLNVNGVVALGTAGPASIPMLIDTPQQLWQATLALPDGVVSNQTGVPGTLPAIYFQGGWLSCAPTGLYWTPVDAGTAARQITLPEPVRSLQSAGRGTVAINGGWLLKSGFQWLEIPGLSRLSRKLEAHP